MPVDAHASGEESNSNHLGTQLDSKCDYAEWTTLTATRALQRPEEYHDYLIYSSQKLEEKKKKKWGSVLVDPRQRVPTWSGTVLTYLT